MSMVVFVSIRENQLQERIWQSAKWINARLAAEKGVYDTITLINSLLASNSTTSQIQSAIARMNPRSLLAVSHYSPPDLHFVSEGKFQDARASIKARFQITTGVSPFSGGVVACDSLQLSGSGTINSYDPTKGDANAADNDLSNAKVKVIDGKGNAGLDGNAR